MEKNRCLTKIITVCMAFFLLAIVWGAYPVQALDLGKTYDQSNVEEIQDMLARPVLNWVKKGEFVIKTRKLEFDVKVSDYYSEKSKKNVFELGLKSSTSIKCGSRLFHLQCAPLGTGFA